MVPEFFCSEFVIAAFKVARIIDPSVNSSAYQPAAIESFGIFESPEPILVFDRPDVSGTLYGPYEISLPSMPDFKMPKMSDMPDMPKMPDMSDMPDMPKMPDMSDMPDMPKMPDMSDMPDMPKMPDMPDMPKMPDMSDMPDMPKMPDMSDMPDMPKMPDMPDMSDLKMPEMKMPKMPGFDSEPEGGEQGANDGIVNEPTAVDNAETPTRGGK